EARTDEMLLMGLRLAEGIDLDRMASIGGLTPAREAIDALARQGVLEHGNGQFGTTDDEGVDQIRACLGPGLAPLAPGTPARSRGRIRATPSGRLLLNRLVLELSANLEETTPRHLAPLGG